LTVDDLIWDSSTVVLDSVHRSVPVPWPAQWLLGLGIAAALAANVAHGLEHGLIGAAAAGAWRAVALVGFNELLLMIIRGTQETRATPLPRQSEQRHGCCMH
jgi:hypothetical protein